MIEEIKKKEVKINKSSVTINFEKFKNHIEKLNRPKVRKIYNPDASTTMTDKEYFKKKNNLVDTTIY